MNEYDEYQPEYHESHPFNWDEELHDDVTKSNTDEIPW